MAHTIFFSWQADTPTKEGRNLVERALERAVGQIGDDAELEEAVRELAIDRHTKGVAGSPPIVETIFSKIDKAAVFVPDLTFVGKRYDGRPTPNPNVLIEYGWALKSLGHSRMVCVMNTAFGEPTAEAMPFDMRHLRNPILYCCPEGVDDETRRRVRDALAKDLEHALRVVLTSGVFQASLSKPAAHPIFTPRVAEDGRGRFWKPGEALGVPRRSFPRRPEYEIQFADRPIIWFRLFPQNDPGRTWLITDLERFATQNGFFLHPISDTWSGYSFLRDHDRFGICPALSEQPEKTFAVVAVFNTGEVWTADSAVLDASAYNGKKVVPPVEDWFRRALAQYTMLLEKMEIAPPYRWMAGMEDMNGRSLFVPTPGGNISPFGAQGTCRLDVVSAEGIHTPDKSPAESLKPFFVKLYDSCGVPRPNRLDL